MEKLITKRNITISISLLSIIFLIIVYFFINSQNNSQKYFDIILSGLYNNEVKDYENKLNFLSSLKDPDISFFSDLALASTNNLDKYDKLDKDIILLKKALKDLDPETLKNLTFDDNFIFNDFAKIFLLNIDLNNYNEIVLDNNNQAENFYINAVNRYMNEIN